jgi:hypothetical protein
MDDPELDDIYATDSESSVPASIIPKAVENIASTSRADLEEDHGSDQLNGELLPMQLWWIS